MVFYDIIRIQAELSVPHISIPDPVFSISQARAEAIPGMQVTVDIIGGKRTVLSYLLSPIKRASEVTFREI